MKINNVILLLLVLGTLGCQRKIVKPETQNEGVQNTTTTTNEQDSATIVENEKLEQKSYKPLVTDAVRKHVARVNHSEMIEKGGYDETATVVRYFKPDAFKIEAAYVQLTFIKGEVRETSFVLYHPTENKNELSSEIYAIQDRKHNPCDICTLDKIEVIGDNIVGTFVDNFTNTKITKYMDHNFLEMHLSWTDKPYMN